MKKIPNINFILPHKNYTIKAELNALYKILHWAKFIIHELFILELLLLTSVLHLSIKFKSKIYCPICLSHNYTKSGKYKREWIKFSFIWKPQRYMCENYKKCKKTYSIYSNTKFKNKPIPPIFVEFVFLRKQVKIMDFLSELIKLRIDLIEEKSISDNINQQTLSADFIDTMQFFFINCLNEVQKRLFAGLMTIQMGRGSYKTLYNNLGIWPKTIRRGLNELESKSNSVFIGKRIRKPGAGRKKIANSNFKKILNKLMEGDVAGDPITGIKWGRKSLNRLKYGFLQNSFNVSQSTIRKYLKLEGFSLRVNSKVISLSNHPQRNEQFEHIKSIVDEFKSLNYPVISVDGKKSEMIANFRNNGVSWQKSAIKTYDHEFPNLKEGKLTMYGIFDMIQNKGWINCGTNISTTEYAVDSIIWWWEENREFYKNADKILILCDSGGNNSHRSHIWKNMIQERIVNKFNISVYVCHYPPGTSKWNQIEHKLFSYISINWQGIPLTSYELAINYIRTTKTKEGLQVFARLVDKQYKLGISVSEKEKYYLNLTSHEPILDLNYSIAPQKAETLNYLKDNNKLVRISKERYKGGRPPLYWLNHYFNNANPGSMKYDAADLILNKKPKDFGIDGKYWSITRLHTARNKIHNRQTSESQMRKFLGKIGWKRVIEKLPIKEGKSAEWWLNYYLENYEKGRRDHDVSYLILKKSPLDFGYSKELWSAQSLSDVCKKYYNTIGSSKSQVAKFLREIRWGKFGNIY